MKFSIRILRRAWSDGDAIYGWLSSRSPAGAARWYAAFLAASHDLSSNPLRHGLAPESQVIGREVRHRFFKTRRGRIYRLLFVIHDDEVRILRIRAPGQPPVHAADVDL